MNYRYNPRNYSYKKYNNYYYNNHYNNNKNDYNSFNKKYTNKMKVPKRAKKAQFYKNYKDKKLLNKKTRRPKETKKKENVSNNKKVVQFFSPNSPNKLNNIIEKLESAQTSLDIAMYTLTNLKLIDSILKCHNNKVKIRIILDHEMTKKFGYFLHDLLINNISIKINDNPEESMHHKFVIIDSKYIFNGSLNWSEKGVSKNHENILFLENKEIVKEFSSQFDELWNKFNNIITLNDIEQKGKFYCEKKHLPKRYYRNYDRYKNYFDNHGYQKDQFVEDSDEEDEDEDEDDRDNYEGSYYEEGEEEGEGEEEEDDEGEEDGEEYDYDDGYDDGYDDSHEDGYDDSHEDGYDDYDDFDGY